MNKPLRVEVYSNQTYERMVGRERKVVELCWVRMERGWVGEVSLHFGNGGEVEE